MTSEEFWEYVDQSGGPDACWPWAGRVNGRGYGWAWHSIYGTMAAHRLAYTLEVGPIPTGLQILHECDFKLCCNPKHLHPGTQKQNMEECAERGRTALGERGGSHKLSEENVIQIRGEMMMLNDYDLAEKYSVAISTIRSIRYRQTWKYLLKNTETPGTENITGQRIRNGENHPHAQLSNYQAREIWLAAPDIPSVVLAARFGVSPKTVSKIRLGRAWKCVHEAGETVTKLACEGESHPNAKLSNSQAREIWSAPLGVSSVELATRFGVSARVIRRIRHGYKWMCVHEIGEKSVYDLAKEAYKDDLIPA